MSRGLERLRSAYNQGGLSGLATSLTGYVRWRLGGSPVDPPDEPLARRLEKTDSSVVVVLMREYYAAASLKTRPLISVILPTRDRPEHLRSAVASVVAQSYDHWELIVVNDSTDPIPASISAGDQRIKVVNSGGLGVSAARNQGLDAANGDLVTFLDDDNLMDSLWLQALAVSVDQSPGATVFIGAQLVTPDPGYHEHHMIRFPARFDWAQLIEDNFVDMGMLAHRRTDDHRFDESLPALVDWDYVVRLTVDTTPFLVPAVSGLYLTDASARISYGNRQDLVEATRQRFRELRSTEATYAQRQIGHHDVAAIKTMLTRLGQTLGRTPRIQVGDTELALSVADSMIEATVAVLADQHPDVLFVESPPDDAALEALHEGGFVVALNAHRIVYNHPALPHGRPIGDHLWVGAKHPFNPEDLFEGATLVKYGVVDR